MFGDHSVVSDSMPRWFVNRKEAMLHFIQEFTSNAAVESKLTAF